MCGLCVGLCVSVSVRTQEEFHWNKVFRKPVWTGVARNESLGSPRKEKKVDQTSAEEVPKTVSVSRVGVSTARGAYGTDPGPAV